MLNTLSVSLVEGTARERAMLLLDEFSHEILGPYDRFESPHLDGQNIVPQFDDGIVLVRGELAKEQVVVISIEGNFLGGGIGEVSGAKIAGTLEKILEENKNGNRIKPIIIYDTGGVRLQEANYGLLSIAEISSAIVELRDYVPVIGIIPGKVGSFGGMSLTAGLCSAIIMTREGRLGMNGPEVVELEAGVRELNAKNKQLIWKMIGGESRQLAALVDSVVEDDVKSFKQAIVSIWEKEQLPARTKQYNQFLSLFSSLKVDSKIDSSVAVQSLSNRNTGEVKPIEGESVSSRGKKWFEAIAGGPSTSIIPSVLVRDGEIDGLRARFIAVVPNPVNPFYRARNGEVGLLEGWALAKYIHEIIEKDKDEEIKSLIVPIVDVPGQAFGYHEELFGIYLACSAAVDAYTTARLKGHPIVTTIVGKAISGAFLSHGMQGNRIIALDDDEIQVHVMSKKSVSLVTMRTIEELDEAAKEVPAIAYDIKSFKKLGSLFSLVENVQADSPTKSCIEKVRKEIKSGYEDIMNSGDLSLKVRLQSSIARTTGRISSIKVREKIEEQWK